VEAVLGLLGGVCAPLSFHPAPLMRSTPLALLLLLLLLLSVACAAALRRGRA
jgi:hypothetical protein